MRYRNKLFIIIIILKCFTTQQSTGKASTLFYDKESVKFPTHYILIFKTNCLLMSIGVSFYFQSERECHQNVLYSHKASTNQSARYLTLL